MSYDEEQARRRKVVVETPNARREYERSEAVRVPERSGVSATTVGILVVLVVALVTILVLLLMNQSSSTTDANMAAAQQPTPLPQTTIVQQPAPPPPVIVTQPAPAAPAAPIIVTPPAGSGGTTNGTDDLSIQARVDKRIADDPSLSALGVTATVLDGKVTLIGTVKSEALKSRVERAVKELKGVKEVDNQIIVSG